MEIRTFSLSLYAMSALGFIGPFLLFADRDADSVLRGMGLDPDEKHSYISVFQRPGEDFERMVMGPDFDHFVFQNKNPVELFKKLEDSLMKGVRPSLAEHESLFVWSFLEPDLFPTKSVLNYLEREEAEIRFFENKNLYVYLLRSGGKKSFFEHVGKADYELWNMKISESVYKVENSSKLSSRMLDFFLIDSFELSDTVHIGESSLSHYMNLTELSECWANPDFVACVFRDLMGGLTTDIAAINSWEMLHGRKWNHYYPYNEINRTARHLIQLIKMHEVRPRNDEKMFFTTGNENLFPVSPFGDQRPGISTFPGIYSMEGYGERLEYFFEKMVRNKFNKVKDFDSWREWSESAKLLARSLDLMEIHNRDYISVLKEIQNAKEFPIVLETMKEVEELTHEEIVMVLKLFSSNKRRPFWGIVYDYVHMGELNITNGRGLSFESVSLLHGNPFVFIDHDELRNICYKTLVKMEPDVSEEIGMDLSAHPKNQQLIQHFFPEQR